MSPLCIQGPNISHLLLCWRNTLKIATGSPGGALSWWPRLGTPLETLQLLSLPRVVPPCLALAHGQPPAPALQPISRLPGGLIIFIAGGSGGSQGPGAGSLWLAPPAGHRGWGDSERFQRPMSTVGCQERSKPGCERLLDRQLRFGVGAGDEDSHCSRMLPKGRGEGGIAGPSPWWEMKKSEEKAEKG